MLSEWKAGSNHRPSSRCYTSYLRRIKSCSHR